MCVFLLPVIQRADSAADSGIALADRSLSLLALECRPELRNHGMGWVRGEERLRNGGVPILFSYNARNPL